MIAVSEAARNIRCSGGLPIGVTNCLNFGNPHNPEVYYQFVHAIKGMGEACRKFDTPVTGGNVSFYNQSVLKDRTEPVFPTPTIGMVGIVEHMALATTLSFKNEGDTILLVGRHPENAHGSVYVREILGQRLTPVPEFDLDTELKLHQVLTDLIEKGVVRSAHDISEGGLFTTLLESAMAGNLGFRISLPSGVRKDIILFSESQGRAILTISPQNLTIAEQLLTKHDVPFLRLGSVVNSGLHIDSLAFGDLSVWKDSYQNALSNILES
jgi:phosphoribosylformylglycinamidine synthase